MKQGARHGQVTTEKLSQLYKQIESAADEIFDRDEDGDLPVEIQLVDRTRHESIMGLMPVPHMIRAETPADFDEILRPLLSNLGRIVRDIEMLLQIRKSANQKLQLENNELRSKILRLLGGASGATDEQIIHNLKAVIEMANKPPEKIEVEVEVEKRLPPKIYSVNDLVVGDSVLIFPTIGHSGAIGEVIEIVEAGRPLTEPEIQVWLNPDPTASSKQWIRMRKSVSYERFVVKRDDGSYMLVPRIPEQVSQLLAVLR